MGTGVLDNLFASTRVSFRDFISFSSADFESRNCLISSFVISFDVIHSLFLASNWVCSFAFFSE